MRNRLDQSQKDQNDKEQGQCEGIQWSWEYGKAMRGLACRLLYIPTCIIRKGQCGSSYTGECQVAGPHSSFVMVQNMKTVPIFSPTVDDSHYLYIYDYVFLLPYPHDIVQLHGCDAFHI